MFKFLLATGLIAISQQFIDFEKQYFQIDFPLLNLQYIKDLYIDP